MLLMRKLLKAMRNTENSGQILLQTQLMCVKFVLSVESFLLVIFIILFISIFFTFQAYRERLQAARVKSHARTTADMTNQLELYGLIQIISFLPFSYTV